MPRGKIARSAEEGTGAYRGFRSAEHPETTTGSHWWTRTYSSRRPAGCKSSDRTFAGFRRVCMCPSELSFFRSPLCLSSPRFAEPSGVRIPAALQDILRRERCSCGARSSECPSEVQRGSVSWIRRLGGPGHSAGSRLNFRPERHLPTLPGREAPHRCGRNPSHSMSRSGG